MCNSSSQPQASHANVELKARLESLEQARQVAVRLATDHLEDQHQTDTYFCCQRGRLKLREIRGRQAELIWYDRPDQDTAKTSRYSIVPIEESEQVRQALTAALGVVQVVRKHREIYLADNVRIHLDQVEGLGEFLEFEAVLGPDVDDAQGQAQVERLSQEFQLTPASLQTGSYADLLSGEDLH